MDLVYSLRKEFVEINEIDEVTGLKVFNKEEYRVTIKNIVIRNKSQMPSNSNSLMSEPFFERGYIMVLMSPCGSDCGWAFVINKITRNG